MASESSMWAVAALRISKFTHTFKAGSIERLRSSWGFDTRPPLTCGASVAS